MATFAIVVNIIAAIALVLMAWITVHDYNLPHALFSIVAYVGSLIYQLIHCWLTIKVHIMEVHAGLEGVFNSSLLLRPLCVCVIFRTHVPNVSYSPSSLQTHLCGFLRCCFTCGLELTDQTLRCLVSVIASTWGLAKSVVSVVNRRSQVFHQPYSV